jgi:UDP-N-acetylglucosamine 2-epimerase (non-hydrolysing)
MVAVVFGTTGELIKLSPVLTRLIEAGAPAFTICTGQQVEQIPQLLDDFNLSQPDLWLARGNGHHDLKRLQDLPPWLSRIVIAFGRHRQMLRERLTSPTERALLLVHGDTLTTVLGALMGRAMNIPVAHIEAGMRSGDWRNPFPEELDRVATARLARIHFAPNAQAASNLRAMKARGAIIDTGGNTICDALELVQPSSLDPDLPCEPFGLVSLHRFELLGKPTALLAILTLLQAASRSTPIVFIDHPVTAAAIAAHDFDGLFDRRFRRVPRQSYSRFISILKASSFLVTDSGGAQQECAQLGHPCLVHRTVTEHSDGLGSSVVLSNLDIEVARAFLDDPLAYTSPPIQPLQHPSDVIVDHLKQGGYIASINAPRAGAVALGNPSRREGTHHKAGCNRHG